MISVLMGAVESGKGDKVLFSYWCHSFAAGHYYKMLWVFLSDFNHLSQNVFRNLIQKVLKNNFEGFGLLVFLFKSSFLEFKLQLTLCKPNNLNQSRSKTLSGGQFIPLWCTFSYFYANILGSRLNSN